MDVKLAVALAGPTGVPEDQRVISEVWEQINQYQLVKKKS